jgi:phosphate:Na+ symporter
MSTAVSVLGGVGLFLVGMVIMTDGLKAMAGSSLRAVLAKATETPLRGVIWGSIVTLLVQSSSATTMTTIGLVSAGLLSFPQGLGLVFGANVGTTGTGWLVALIGVRISLTAAALPMIFLGAITKLLGSGRIAGAGAALAGFGLVLFGLTTLQQGMGGLAEKLHPSDLPAVLAGPGTAWWLAALGVIGLVALGLAMTALMQSSTAAVAMTLSAYHAGAVGLDQACALIIGQNIGTATSSAMAAIGASVTAKRLAVAYVMFKLIAAAIALALFYTVARLLIRASAFVDGATVLAAYHTAYNVIGVAVLLPFIHRFTRLVERILPERGSTLTRSLDRAALDTPVATVEAVRRTIARVLARVCGSAEAALNAAGGNASGVPVMSATSRLEVDDALSQAQAFMAGVSGPLESDDERDRITSTLHALDHVYRLTEAAGREVDLTTVADGPDEVRSTRFFVEAMRNGRMIADAVAAPRTDDGRTGSTGSSRVVDVGPDQRTGSPATSFDLALAQLKECTSALDDLERTHRRETLGAVGPGTLTVDTAIARADAVRHLKTIAHHAWRCAAHLVGRSA